MHKLSQARALVAHIQALHGAHIQSWRFGQQLFGQRLFVLLCTKHLFLRRARQKALWDARNGLV